MAAPSPAMHAASPAAGPQPPAAEHADPGLLKLIRRNRRLAGAMLGLQVLFILFGALSPLTIGFAVVAGLAYKAVDAPNVRRLRAFSFCNACAAAGVAALFIAALAVGAPLAGCACSKSCVASVYDALQDGRMANASAHGVQGWWDVATHLNVTGALGGEDGSESSDSSEAAEEGDRHLAAGRTLHWRGEGASRGGGDDEVRLRGSREGGKYDGRYGHGSGSSSSDYGAEYEGDNEGDDDDEDDGDEFDDPGQAWLARWLGRARGLPKDQFMRAGKKVCNRARGAMVVVPLALAALFGLHVAAARAASKLARHPLYAAESGRRAEERRARRALARAAATASAAAVWYAPGPAGSPLPAHVPAWAVAPMPQQQQQQQVQYPQQGEQGVVEEVARALRGGLRVGTAALSDAAARMRGYAPVPMGASPPAMAPAAGGTFDGAEPQPHPAGAAVTYVSAAPAMVGGQLPTASAPGAQRPSPGSAAAYAYHV